MIQCRLGGELAAPIPRSLHSVGCDHPDVTAIDRLAAARWLESAGELERATQLLRWNEVVWQYPYCFADAVERVLSPVASLEQARLEDARGHTVLARSHY